jgi:hypothetical protein
LLCLLLSRTHNMQSGRCAQVPAGHVVLSGLAGAVAEPLARAHKEVNRALRARLTVSDPILPEYARRLYEELSRLRSFGCACYSFRCRQLNHLLFSPWQHN